ncbi:hypothetical protein C8J57DRAFT_1515423 [Mycena rebaudengoi]|nr:hypothetical protein C8J57DRAFT_1517082 [Mycena rebaudengoi]KAJ7259346.1 hypothetical protein C8J57DRAFT_1515423 [Mycena rebaudengoi]
MNDSLTCCMQQFPQGSFLVTAIAGAVAGFFSTSVRRLFGAPPTDPEWNRMNELP